MELTTPPMLLMSLALFMVYIVGLTNCIPSNSIGYYAVSYNKAMLA